MDLEVRHLRCFLVLAEELNFTRAATRLGVPQPALSTQIRRIERHLGTPLFERTTRSVVLTEAGRRMLPLARSVDLAMHALEEGMTAPGTARRLRFGTEDHPLTLQVSAVEAAFPGLSFEIRTMEPPGCFEALSAGAVDMVFGYDTPLLPMTLGPELRVATVTDLPWWIALPVNHRLAVAAQERVSLAELAADPWFARPADTALYRLTVASCQQYGGFTPDVRYTTIRTDVMFELLEQGRAVGLAAPIAERYKGPFYLAPLAEEFGRRLVLAWRPATVPTGVAEAMLRQLRELFAEFTRDSPRFYKEVLSAPEKYPHLHALLE
jgi:LysR family transcriptional regulator, benzoate and cis,cis-muconate-responsive activator of ben and cat genes